MSAEAIRLNLLSHAQPGLIPFLTIGAFAGLRHTELLRLDWSEVKAEFIEVTKKKAKTRSRRLVPIQPNLQKWLADHRKESGPIVVDTTFPSIGGVLAMSAIESPKQNSDPSLPLRNKLFTVVPQFGVVVVNRAMRFIHSASNMDS